MHWDKNDNNLAAPDHSDRLHGWQAYGDVMGTGFNNSISWMNGWMDQ